MVNTFHMCSPMLPCNSRMELENDKCRTQVLQYGLYGLKNGTGIRELNTSNFDALKTRPTPLLRGLFATCNCIILKLHFTPELPAFSFLKKRIPK
jgi:hypothetical protein